ncbi:hypothetical protein J4223_03475 [Candidatus Woesearchaeota archaeon]|nr:hypothetical protein [Candidatus Woesearchaeota archaeon]
MEQPKKEEIIGFHKGAISVLAMEQQEFSKILQVVQQQIQGHVNALKELGIDLEAESKKIQEKNKDDLNERLK